MVFCRNVLIYFDQATKIDVLDRIDEVIERDGFLVLGGAETVVGLDPRVQAGGRQARPLRAQSGAGNVARVSSEQRGAAGAGRGAYRQRAVTRDRRTRLRDKDYGFSTIFPFARRCSTRSCARAASASGNAAAIAGLTPPASSSTAACIAWRRGSGM